MLIMMVVNADDDHDYVEDDDNEVEDDANEVEDDGNEVEESSMRASTRNVPLMNSDVGQVHLADGLRLPWVSFKQRVTVGKPLLTCA